MSTRTSTAVERWLVWFKCRECGETLFVHDPGYSKQHDRMCPVASRKFPARDGLDKSWRVHIWEQQKLEPHLCAYEGESIA